MKNVMTTVSVSRANFLAALDRFVDAATELSAADWWPTDEGVETSAGYPRSMPSFDEFLGELIEWRNRQKTPAPRSGGMGHIVTVRGDDLSDFMSEVIEPLVECGGRAFEVSFAIDDGLKVKVNGRTWSRPHGKVAR